MGSKEKNSTKEIAANTKKAILTFLLAEQEYGLPIHDVVQIIEMVAIVKLPRLPHHVQGIINYHGQIVPVVDIRLCLGLPYQTYNLHTPIILVHSEAQILALVVDEVIEVTEMATAVSPTQKHNTLLTGIAQNEQHLIPMLNLAILLSEEDQAQVTQVLDNNVEAVLLQASSIEELDS